MVGLRNIRPARENFQSCPGMRSEGEGLMGRNGMVSGSRGGTESALALSPARKRRNWGRGQKKRMRQKGCEEKDGDGAGVNEILASGSHWKDE
jgi:hypothetical protein